MSTPETLSQKSLLVIEHLSVSYGTRTGRIPAVVDVSLRIAAGECVGLVGESGCGKSTLALASMRYLGQQGHIVRGRIFFQGRDVTRMSPRQLRQIRGVQMAMVYQEPSTALNPSLTIGTQLAEVLSAHTQLAKSAARERIRHMLLAVHLADGERLLTAYPHQLSGGQQQRVVIAMALLLRPALLILDEPTTALDVTVEAGLIELLTELRHTFGLSMLYISHNLGRIAEVCNRVYVMYAGEIVEEGSIAQVFGAMRHPYTYGLWQALPRPAGERQTRPLRGIRGQPPVPTQRPPGCVFAPRCDYMRPGLCDTTPPVLQAVDDTAALQQVRCIRWRDIQWLAEVAAENLAPVAQVKTPILQVQALRKDYPLAARLFAPLRRWQRQRYVRACEAVSFTAHQQETVAIVGESGGGKTTVARVLVGLETATSGQVLLLGHDVAQQAVTQRSAEQRRAIQMVFQQPSETLNPSLTIGHQIIRALKKSGVVASRATLRTRLLELLARVHLSPAIVAQKPSQLSGGQKQRVAIARALAGQPVLVVADEPVSALDLSVQAAVLELLGDLQRTAGMTLLLISHDLGVVRYMADYVVVMYLGQVMEQGPTAEVFAAPYHPYTEALLSAIPSMDLHAKPRRIVLEGTLPSVVHPPQGCPFVTRCWRQPEQVCAEEKPPVQQVTASHSITCHIPQANL